jgi:hypothetical protein
LGKVIIEPQFAKANDFSEGLALVQVLGKTERERINGRTFEGFIDTKGEFAFAPQPPDGVEKIVGFQTYFLR